MSRLGRERRTIAVMVALYCRDHHDPAAGPPDESASVSHAAKRDGVLCADCEELLAYADHRVAHCRFGQSKPTCAHCPVHCFRPERRDEVRTVMRYSGPRMTFRHPVLALGHLIDSRLHRVEKPSRGGPGGGQAIR